jgi:hypothetical protein
MAAHPPGPPSPPAVRLRRPGWRDPRLLLGVMLVAGSVALGSAVVSGAARTVPVYAAAGPLVPGDPVEADALVVREVRLGEAADGYLRADAALPAGLVAVRTVGAGELVPRAAVADGAALDVRPVAITPDGPLPRGLAEGATVDLWFVPPDAPWSAAGAVAGSAGAGPEAAAADGAEPAARVEPAAAPLAPRQLVGGLTVAEVAEVRPGFGVGGGGATVHVLVPVAELPVVLAALASDGSVQVVLVPGA